jgi:flagellar biosynthesis protein FlhF
METSLPVAWYTDGQKIPQDLHPAEALALVQLGVERLKGLRQEQAAASGS